MPTLIPREFSSDPEERKKQELEYWKQDNADYQKALEQINEPAANILAIAKEDIRKGDLCEIVINSAGSWISRVKS